jgi:hypothetical protein
LKAARDVQRYVFFFLLSIVIRVTAISGLGAKYGLHRSSALTGPRSGVLSLGQKAHAAFHQNIVIFFSSE